MLSQKRQLSVTQRLLLVDLRNQGQSYGQISQATGYSRSTIQSVINKYQTKDTVLDLDGRGRRRKTTPQIDRSIVSMVQSDRRLSAVQIARQLQESDSIAVSAQTIRNRLHDSQFRSRVARKKPFLKDDHKQARLDFALRHQYKPIEFWRKILWSDESKFNRISSDGPVKVWRKSNEAYQLACMRGTVKHGGGNVMVWGCMSYNGVGQLAFIDERMTAEVYSRILDNNLFQSADRLHLPSDFIFQQDNDPKHTARSTKAWMDEYGVLLLQWPAQSPDLNPIEHLWDQLERKAGNRRCKTDKELKDLLTDAWNRLESEKIRNLVDSMPRRLAAVITADGGPTKY